MKQAKKKQHVHIIIITMMVQSLSDQHYAYQYSNGAQHCDEQYYNHGISIIGVAHSGDVPDENNNKFDT